MLFDYRNYLLFKMFLDSEFKWYYTRSYNKVLIKGSVGVASAFLPSFFFFKPYKRTLCFLFTSKAFFTSFVKHFMVMHNSISKLFYFKVKLRGLGYRIRKLSKHFLRFFFARNHYYYFNMPQGLFVKQKIKTLLVVASDKAKLNNVFSQLLILKKMDMYDKTNSFLVKNKIFFLKKRK